MHDYKHTASNVQTSATATNNVLTMVPVGLSLVLALSFLPFMMIDEKHQPDWMLSTRDWFGGKPLPRVDSYQYLGRILELQTDGLAKIAFNTDKQPKPFAIWSPYFRSDSRYIQEPVYAKTTRGHHFISVCIGKLDVPLWCSKDLSLGIADARLTEEQVKSGIHTSDYIPISF